MNSPFGSLDLKDLGAAVAHGVIAAVLAYLAGLTDIFSVNLHQVLSVAILAAATSLLTALGTTNDGKLLGAVKIK